MISSAGYAGNGSGNNLSRTELFSIVSEYSKYDGVDVFSVGSLGTSALKSLIKMSVRADGDKEALEALKIINGVKKIAIIDYEDCSSSVRNAINRKVQKALSNSDLLMEFKDDDSRMSIYGVVDGNATKVKDFVLYDADGCSLICLFGSIPVDAVTRLANQ